jgi:hypothetical protein
MFRADLTFTSPAQRQYLFVSFLPNAAKWQRDNVVWNDQQLRNDVSGRIEKQSISGI